MSEIKKIEPLQSNSSIPPTENNKINPEISLSSTGDELSPSLEERLEINFLADFTNKNWKSVAKVINFHFYESRKVRSSSDCKNIWKNSKKSPRHRRSNTQVIFSTYNKFKEQARERKEYLNLVQRSFFLENIQQNNEISPLQSFRSDDLESLSESFSYESIEIISANTLLDNFCFN